MYLIYCAYIQTILTRILTELEFSLPYLHTHRTETQLFVLILSFQAQYAKDKGLAGAMAWALESDDFRNNCGEGAFPLLTAINKGLGRL